MMLRINVGSWYARWPLPEERPGAPADTRKNRSKLLAGNIQAAYRSDDNIGQIVSPTPTPVPCHPSSA